MKHIIYTFIIFGVFGINTNVYAAERVSGVYTRQTKEEACDLAQSSTKESGECVCNNAFDAQNCWIEADKPKADTKESNTTGN